MQEECRGGRSQPERIAERTEESQRSSGRAAQRQEDKEHKRGGGMRTRRGIGTQTQIGEQQRKERNGEERQEKEWNGGERADGFLAI